MDLVKEFTKFIGLIEPLVRDIRTLLNETSLMKQDLQQKKADLDEQFSLLRTQQDEVSAWRKKMADRASYEQAQKEFDQQKTDFLILKEKTLKEYEDKKREIQDLLDKVTLRKSKIEKILSDESNKRKVSEVELNDN